MKRKIRPRTLAVWGSFFICFMLLYGALPAAARTVQERMVSGVTPVQEVKPVTPVSEITPITPITPIKPVQPVKPVTPIEPVKPIKPITPVEPISAITPVTPVEPGMPVPENTPTVSEGSAVAPNAETQENSAVSEQEASGSVTYLSSTLQGVAVGQVSGESSAAVQAQTQGEGSPWAIALTVVIFILGFGGALVAVNPELRRRIKNRTSQKGTPAGGNSGMTNEKLNDKSEGQT